MKKIYIILIALFLVNGARAQWFSQNSGTTVQRNSVYFTDANTGYAVGENQIIKTTDGGENWESQNSGITGCLYSVHFPNKDTGYAVGDGGVILKTTNGGKNWVSQNSGTNFKLSSVYFPATDTGFIAGYLNKIIKIFSTTDGTNWVVKYSYLPFFSDGAGLNSVHFSDVNTGYAVGWNTIGTSQGGMLLKTTDGGTNWTFPNVSGEFISHANSVYFTDANTGYIVGSTNFWQNKIFRTTDGGENWTTYELGNYSYLNSIYFPHPDTGYTVGYDYNNVGIILKTTDGGANWVTQDAGTYADLLSVHFPTVDTGYVVGVGGTILKTVNGGGFPVGNNDLSSKSSTLKIYPNPSSDNITVETSVKPQSGTLSIMNLHGQQIITHQITDPTTQINISELHSGVYFVRLKGDTMVQVEKIIKE